jgi:hypothetical protein
METDMKKIILAAALTLTAASAFAQYAGRCEIGLTDRYGRVQLTFRSNSSDCFEAMKECRKTIRMDGRFQVGINDCVELSSNPGPQNPGPQNPGPQYPGPQNPGPQYPGPQNPYPGQTGYDARRMINNGESVILNSKYVTVMGVSFNGLYAVRSTDGWNTITNNVRREDLSVTNGCNANICIADSVINVRTAKYVKVVGLQYLTSLNRMEQFIVQSTDGWNTLSSNVEQSDLAATKGCINSRFAQICVGNQVINQQNRYSTIVGVQLDGRVVLRSTDGWNTITTNVDPSTLVITR